MAHNNKMHDALVKIVETANSAMEGEDKFEEYEQIGSESRQVSTEHKDIHGCVIKSLPERLQMEAAKAAVTINPANAPVFGLSPIVARSRALAVIIGRCWGPTPRQLAVSFMENAPADLKKRIIGHMNAWTKTGCVSFVGTDNVGDVRISFGPGGFFSYLGTDILFVPKNRQTMNLEGFSMSTPESEYLRVVRHETGHTLGFPHEHLRREIVNRIDPEKAHKWFWEVMRWEKEKVDQNVLTPLDESEIKVTPTADETSIMCYQLPGSITKDGKPILGGTDINAADYAFCGKIYPKPGHQVLKEVPQTQDWDQWSDAEDVKVAV